MEREPAELLKDALALPVEARAALIGSLIDSLDPEVDEDAEDAWRAEIRLRLAQIDSGAVKMIPWDEARRRIQDSMRRLHKPTLQSAGLAGKRVRRPEAGC